MIEVILERSARANKVSVGEIVSQGEKLFVREARAMVVGAMDEVGLTDEVIKEAINKSTAELKDMRAMHKQQLKRAGYYSQGYMEVMCYINEPEINESDYTSREERSLQAVIMGLKSEIESLQTKIIQLKW